MIIDKQNVFDWQAALTETRDSTDIIDLVSNRDIAESLGTGLVIRVQVYEALVSGGSSTLTISVAGSTDGSAWTTYISTPAMAKAGLVAGAHVDLDWPPAGLLPNMAKPKQIKLIYTVGTTDFTGGKVSAFVLLNRQANHAYPAGVTVAN